MKRCELVTSSYRTALSFYDLFKTRLLANIKNSSELNDEFSVFSEQVFMENFLKVFFDLVEKSCYVEDFLLCDESQLKSNKYNTLRDRRFIELLNVTISTLKEFHGDGWTKDIESAWCAFKEEVLMIRNRRLLQSSYGHERLRSTNKNDDGKSLLPNGTDGPGGTGGAKNPRPYLKVVN